MQSAERPEALVLRLAGGAQPPAPDLELELRPVLEVPDLEVDRRRAVRPGVMPLGEDVPTAQVRMEPGREVRRPSPPGGLAGVFPAVPHDLCSLASRHGVIAGLHDEPRGVPTLSNGALDDRDATGSGPLNARPLSEGAAVVVEPLEDLGRRWRRGHGDERATQ